MNPFETESRVATEPRYASTLQVANALGISVTTVKRWVDEGILPAHRTIGGHRKILMTDVIRLAREGNLPQADLSNLMPKPQDVDLSDPHVIRDQLLDAVKIPDAELVRAIIHGAYRHGYPIEVLADHVIAPTMYQIGLEWESGQIQVFQEHRATQLVVAALYELRAQLRTRVESNRPVAIGGAPEHDHTILGSLLAKLVLIDAGWDAINLGPHTPTSALLTALEDVRPRLVWLSVTHLENPEYFLEGYKIFYRQAEKMGVPVAIGGGGLTEEIRARMPYTTHGDGLTHLAAFAKLLHRHPSQPRRGRPTK